MLWPRLFMHRMPSISRSSSSMAPPSNKANTPNNTDKLPYVNEVMAEVRLDWPLLTADTYNPIPLALDLNKGGNRIQNAESFKSLLQRLENAMDIIINQYYQGFNNAVDIFGGVVDGLNDSQSTVGNLKEITVATKGHLSFKGKDLLDTWSKSAEYVEIVRLLKKVDSIKLIPDNVVKFMRDNDFFKACQLIADSKLMLSDKDLSNVGALDGIRELLVEKQTHVFDIVIQELQLLLYTQKSDRLTSRMITSKIGYFLNCLIVIDQLAEGLKIIHRKLPRHLSQAVIEIIVSVENHFRRDGSSQIISNTFHQSAESSYRVLSHAINAICSAFNEFTENHFFVFSHIKEEYPKLKGKKDYDSYFAYSMNDVWIAIQNELKIFVTGYITIATTSSPTENIPSINELLKSKKGYATHPKKQIFTIRGTTSEDEVKKLVDKQFESAGIKNHLFDNAIKEYSMPLPDPYSLKRVVAGYKLLVPPDLNLIRVLTVPCLTFVTSLQLRIFGPENKEIIEFERFLDSVLTRQYFPQLEEQSKAEFTAMLNAADSFQVGSSSSYAEMSSSIPTFPIFKCFTSFWSLLQRICRYMFATPNSLKNFEKILLDFYVSFYERCITEYREIMFGSTGMANDATGRPLQSSSAYIIMSGNLANNDDMIKLFAENTAITSQYDAKLNQMLAEKEILLINRIKKERSLHRSEIITNPKHIKFLAHLYYSLSWFLTKCSEHHWDSNLLDASSVVIKNDVVIFDEAIGNGNSKLIRATLYSNTKQESLFFSSSFSIDYRKFIKQFTQFMNMTLYTLRLEIRCRCIYYLDLALREETYFLEDISDEPVAYVISLNSNLVQLNNMFMTNLPPITSIFLFDGLGQTLNHLLISNARYVKRMNINGLEKMKRNIAALQQNLLSVCTINETRLDKSIQYYDLTKLAGEELVNFARNNDKLFSFPEYKSILDLIYEENDQELNEAVKARRAKDREAILLKLQTIFNVQINS